MDKDKLIERYVAGESVSALARDFKISRPTVIGYLKRAGVHKPGSSNEATPIVSNIKSEATPLPKSKKKARSKATPHGKGTMAAWRARAYCPIDSIVVVDPELLGASYERLGRNLHANKDGYLIRHYHDGEMIVEKYKDEVAIEAKYGALLEGKEVLRHPYMV